MPKARFWKYVLPIGIFNEPMIFRKKKLLEPGIDYILKDLGSFTQGIEITLRKRMRRGHTLTYFEYDNVYLFESDGINLIDKSNDKPGYENRYTEWLS